MAERGGLINYAQGGQAGGLSCLQCPAKHISWGVQFGGDGTDSVDELKEYGRYLYVCGRSTSTKIFDILNPRGSGVACAYVAVFDSRTLKLKTFVWDSGGFTGSNICLCTSFVVEESGNFVLFQIGQTAPYTTTTFPIYYSVKRLDFRTGATLASITGNFALSCYYPYIKLTKIIDIARTPYFHAMTAGYNSNWPAAHRLRITRINEALTVAAENAGAGGANLIMYVGYPEHTITGGDHLFNYGGDPTAKYFGRSEYHNDGSAWAAPVMTSPLGSPEMNYLGWWAGLPYDATNRLAVYRESANYNKIGICAIKKQLVFSISKQSLLITDSVSNDTYFDPGRLLGRVAGGTYLLPCKSKNAMFGGDGSANNPVVLHIVERGGAFVLGSFVRFPVAGFAIAINGPVNNIDEANNVIAPFEKTYYFVAGETSGSLYAPNAGGNDVFISRQTV